MTYAVDEQEEHERILRELFRQTLDFEMKEQAHADYSSLKKIDLSSCGLENISSQLPEILPNLSILFLSNNHFQEMPELIGKFRNLQMVAFKNNKMQRIHPEALQPQLRWLILTNNQIKDIPDTIGRCKKLQKCMLSGNQIESLPESMQHCHKLELIRLACNRLSQPPIHILRLPNLCWTAFAENPFLQHVQIPETGQPPPVLHHIPEATGEVLGSGAGGITRKVQLQNGEVVAVKTYAGAMTSDGSPKSERQIAAAASRLSANALVRVIGETPTGELVMEFLENFRALANPPDWDTCSRDVYDDSFVLDISMAIHMILQLLDALAELHAVGITHGDFYAHNILVNFEKYAVRLTDFGAAHVYDKACMKEYGDLLEQIELRAFAIFVAEVVDRVVHGDFCINQKNGQHLLKDLAQQCRKADMTFETVQIYWKQTLLKDVEKAFHF